MRQIVNLNTKWAFSKEATQVPSEIDKKWNFVNLPHSWNAIDGQDGDSDYYRGTAYYAKKLKKSELEPNLKTIRDDLGLPENCPIIPFSAEKGFGKDELIGLLNAACEK